MSLIERQIKHKIETLGTKLKDWDVNLFRGILTGYNEAFIISGEKKEEILTNCRTEEERDKTDKLIRPILRGRDIKRYDFEFGGLYLIATFPSLHYNIDDFPALKNYLEGFEPKLRQTGENLTPVEIKKVLLHGEANGISLKAGDLVKSRKKTNNKWFETQDSISYWEDFYKQKIVWGNLNLKGSYTIVPEGYFINAPCPMIVPANRYLLAVLNSKVADYYIRSLGVTRNGGYFEYKPMFIEKLPVPLLCESEQNELIALLNDSNRPSSEKLLEDAVYKLYQLTEEEISFIQSL